MYILQNVCNYFLLFSVTFSYSRIFWKMKQNEALRKSFKLISGPKGKLFISFSLGLYYESKSRNSGTASVSSRPSCFSGSSSKSISEITAAHLEMNPPPEDLTVPRSSLDASHGLSVCPSCSCLSYLSRWCVGAERKVIMEVCVCVEVRFRLFPLILGGSWQQSPLIHPCAGRPAALVPLGVEQAVWDQGSTLGSALPCLNLSTSCVHLELCLVIITCLTYTILVLIWSEGLWKDRSLLIGLVRGHFATLSSWGRGERKASSTQLSANA